MDFVGEQINLMLGSYLPNLLGGFVILIVGWLTATVLSNAVRSVLKRTTVDNRLTKWVLGEESQQKIEIEKWIALVVFYVIMLFVLVGFFETIRLNEVISPLNSLLDQIVTFIPRLIGAGVLLVIAWFVGTFLRLVITRVLRIMQLDTRVSAGLDDKNEQVLPVSRVIGDGVYWLVFLVFLPAILEALGLQGLLVPVQGLLDEVLSYIPNLFAAGLILAVGWFVARVLQRMVSSFLIALGIDRIGQNVGLNNVLGVKGLSRMIGYIVYVLVFIPILISALDTLALDAVTVPATNMLNELLAALPQIFAATLVLFVSYVVGRIGAGITAGFLARIGFNSVLRWIGLGREYGADDRSNPSDVVGYIVLTATLLFASVEAFELVGFHELAGLVNDFIRFAGQVLLGTAVFGAGLYISQFVATVIRRSGAEQSSILALAARISILVLAGAMSLRQMGIAQDIVNLAFGLMLGAVSVAVALAFGLGGKDVAARELEGILDSLRSKKSSHPQE